MTVHPPLLVSHQQDPVLFHRLNSQDRKASVGRTDRINIDRVQQIWTPFENRLTESVD